MTAASANPAPLAIGVDVGGTFTDLVASDGNALHIIKIPSTPPDFHRAVIEAVRQAAVFGNPDRIIHGSTVATNALLQRAGAAVAFVTTHGFRDMLLIGRQNRPDLYSLHAQRPRPLTAAENGFTVRERISATGEIIEPLDESELDRLVAQIRARNLEQVAVCLLFSFINPTHEQAIARRCQQAGLAVSLSSDILPEFREYERAITTVINAAMRPVVRDYLAALESGLAKDAAAPASLRIMHSGGGTLSVADASAHAARLLLSGPAGGVMGAAFAARQAGFTDAITYDMGGTSTDVAVILEGRPQWTTSTTIDGLPIGLPMFDIHTVGAGGGSVAYLDAGGALRVGPRSAGAIPGPACYGRGGVEPTVTDANLVLGRIVPEHFLGGAMRIAPELARSAVASLAAAIGKSVTETALGIVRVAEANMEKALRQVTSRRGHDPRQFTLVSFGGAGGLHAFALAEALDIRRVLIPPNCGVLSALGMIVAPPIADASRTVVHLGAALDDDRLAAELGSINGQTIDVVPHHLTERVEAFADVRFQGQSHELTVKLDRPTREHATAQFVAAYRQRFGRIPENRPTEIVTLRIRRYGRTPTLELPPIPLSTNATPVFSELVANEGNVHRVRLLTRGDLAHSARLAGPLLLLDPQATTYIPPNWSGALSDNGSVIAERV